MFELFASLNKFFFVFLFYCECTIYYIVIVCYKRKYTIYYVVIVIICKRQRIYYYINNLTFLKIKINFHFFAFVENIRKNFNCFDNCNNFINFKNDNR